MCVCAGVFVGVCVVVRKSVYVGVRVFVCFYEIMCVFWRAHAFVHVLMLSAVMHNNFVQLSQCSEVIHHDA